MFRSSGLPLSGHLLFIGLCGIKAILMPFPLTGWRKILNQLYQSVIETGRLGGQPFGIQAEKIAVLVGKSRAARHLPFPC
jgi:hypothetical protein